jgi:IS30 family transposase
MPLVGVYRSLCDRIADKLNSRPRKRYNYRTPKELFT